MLQRWLTDPRVTADVVSSENADGHSPFSAAACAALDSRDELSLAERAAAAACARLVAASGKCDPSAATSAHNVGHLTYAAAAGLSEVVEQWLTDPRVTADVVNHKGGTGYSAFSAAVFWAMDLAGQRTVEERGLAASCARLLASSGLCDPTTLDYGRNTHLSWAAAAGLSYIMQRWMTDPRVTAAVVNSKGKMDATAFSAAA